MQPSRYSPASSSDLGTPMIIYISHTYHIHITYISQCTLLTHNHDHIQSVTPTIHIIQHGLFYRGIITQYIEQKMENTSLITQVFNKVGSPASICNELHLDVSSLAINDLLQNTTYRRLYNIVINDMSRSQLSFRKNLIKELYFLLQITPIIRNQLKDSFLGEVERWYNLNDHKKIDLASNKLSNLYQYVNHKKAGERPKSGVSWNTNISPFLRPYTAGRKGKHTYANNSSNASNTPYSNPYTSNTLQSNGRPESSKTNQLSSTNVDSQDYHIRQFTTNIQQQLQISEDFVKKHRTIHPQYEPIYEQLYQILKRIEGNKNGNDNQDQDQILPTVKPKLNVKNGRYVKSAMPKQTTPQPQLNKKESDQLSMNLEGGQTLNQANQQNMGTYQNLGGNIDEGSENQSSEAEQYIFTSHKKAYADIQDEEDITFTNRKMNERQRYSHLINNKIVESSKEDKELAKKYINFARVKSAMRRQFNRKSESRRLLSGKSLQFKTSSIVMKGQLPKDIEDSEEDIKEEEQENPNTIEDSTNGNGNNKTRINTSKSIAKEKKLLEYDLTAGMRPLTAKGHPTYNQRQILKQVYQRGINDFKKIHKITPTVLPAKPSQPLSKFQRFMSPIRFDPMSKQNAQKYNQQVLQEIEKIKQKMGGKGYASTDSLMKALYINNHDHDLKWEGKDNAYLMLTNGSKPKKIKKKLKKSGKSTTLLKR